MSRIDSVVALACATALVVGGPGVARSQTPQGTAFTYQGRLTNAGAPAGGSYDFEFRLFDASSGGAQVGPTVPVTGLPVTAGLFTAALDFGSAFAGNKRWLEIRVKPAGLPGYTLLSPRQELTATPVALYAAQASETDPKVGTLSGGSWCVANAAGTAVDCTQPAPVISESDPKVGTLAAGGWCVTNPGGTAIDCAQPAPLTTESDPRVGATTAGAACTGTGSQASCSGDPLTTSEVDYSPARTGYYNVNANAFTPISSTDPYAGVTNGTYRYLSGGTSGQSSLNAGVSLPDGVTVTDFTCWIYDNSAAADIVFLGLADSVADAFICGPFSSGAALAVVRTVGGSCNAVIDNSAATYYAHLAVTNVAACGSNCRIYGCKITYTYTVEGR